MALVKKTLVVVLCLSLCGCGYTRHSPAEYSNWPPDHDTNPIEVGKTVKIQSKDGLVVKGKVESVAESEFEVAGKHILYSEVEVVQVRTFLIWPTVVIAAGVAVLGFVLFTVPGDFSTDN